MIHFLITLIVVLLIIIGAILVLFHRQGIRLNEEIQYNIDKEDYRSQFLEDVGMTVREKLDNIIRSCENVKSQPHIGQHSDVSKAIESILLDCRQLLQYADEVLDISGTNVNIPTSKKINVNLVELIMSYRREIMYDVNDGVQVDIQTELSPHTQVWIDTNILRQLIMQILHCAAMNVTNGTITIRYAKENRGLRFWIDGKCQKAPENVLKAMSADQVGSANEELDSCDKEMIMGMSMCKSIVNSLNGKFDVKSTQIGSEFQNVISFWFPCTID